MQDLFMSEIGIVAELEYRRRQLATHRRIPHDSLPRKSLRVALAEALAHLALHLDGRALKAVADSHTCNPSSVTHHGAA